MRASEVLALALLAVAVTLLAPRIPLPPPPAGFAVVECKAQGGTIWVRVRNTGLAPIVAISVAAGNETLDGAWTPEVSRERPLRWGEVAEFVARGYPLPPGGRLYLEVTATFAGGGEARRSVAVYAG